MEKILVATDGSHNSERALIEAKKHAEHYGGEITILTVTDPLGYQTEYVDAVLETASKTVLKNACKLFEDFKGKIDTKLRRGDSADEIISEAEEGNYDLVVIGSRGLGAFSRTFLGSVSNKVLNHAKTNVLIVK